MYLWPILAIIFAFLEAIAVAKNLRQLEYIAKPAVMLCLFIGLYTSAGFQGRALWFGLGVLFSLAGDVLLMFPRDRLFLLGLIAFLLAHIFYIIGFGGGMESVNLWSLVLLIVIAINVSRLIRRITEALRTAGQAQLIVPVILYGTVVSVMLYAALSTIYNPAWSTSAAFFVSLGAFLFCASDLLLAWNKFVSPLKNGRVWSIALYHLGQIGLIAGVISQFG
jgi:uncharacterized membrane protein YhhN